MKLVLNQHFLEFLQFQVILLMFNKTLFSKTWFWKFPENSTKPYAEFVLFWNNQTYHVSPEWKAPARVPSGYERKEESWLRIVGRAGCWPGSSNYDEVGWVPHLTEPWFILYQMWASFKFQSARIAFQIIPWPEEPGAYTKAFSNIKDPNYLKIQFMLDDNLAKDLEHGQGVSPKDLMVFV